MTYGAETLTFTKQTAGKMSVEQRTMERAALDKGLRGGEKYYLNHLKKQMEIDRLSSPNDR